MLLSATVPKRPITSQGDTPKSAAEGLQTSIRTKNLARIHQDYNAYAQSAMGKKGQSTGPPIVSQAELIELLYALAASGRPNDLALVERVFKDMPPLFRMKITDEIYTVVIRGLLRCGNVQTIYRWLMAMPQKTGRFMTIEHWLLFLEHCLKAGEVGMIRQSIKTMQQSGCKPTNEALKIHIRALFMSEIRLRDIGQAFDDALREGLSFDVSVSALVYDGFVKLGRVHRAAQAQRLYKEKFQETLPGRREQRHDMISAEVERGGLDAAIALCRIFQDQGFRPNERTLTAVLRHSTRLADMRRAEDALGVRANVVHWSILITNSVRLGDLPDALFIYDQSREMGIRPDVTMVHPIINALCYPTLARPNEAAIDRALDLYYHLCHVMSESDSHANPSQARHPPAAGPNAQVYSTLLRTLASSPNAPKYFPKALALLDDMESRKIAMENSISVASVTILLMRSSSNYVDAVNVFKRISNSDNGPGLDDKGYIAILNAFCKLAYDRHDISTSVRHYFEIVREMRRAGHSLTVEVYTIFLQQLSMGKHLNRFDLLFSIREIHNHLVLDTSLSPDIALWNQLMDAYQRTGSFRHALTIWDMIFISNQYDNTSVSVILDACAFADSWSVATSICSRLFDEGSFFSQRNWNTWLECMCRLGKLDDAVKLMCLEMGKHQHDVSPDVESVRILFKFAQGTHQKADVQFYVKQYLPNLWESIPEAMRI
jgi:pentatricopeptide repeat protein